MDELAGAFFTRHGIVDGGTGIIALVPGGRCTSGGQYSVGGSLHATGKAPEIISVHLAGIIGGCYERRSDLRSSVNSRYKQPPGDRPEVSYN